VPVEISSSTYALGVLDDPELVERGWVTAYEHPLVGRLQQFGLLFDFSDTPGVIAGPPLTVGAETRAILTELGLASDEIDRLCDDKVVLDAGYSGAA
jgi:crotonobetainyl-CoA:carnitine CoA-transferase CaiB-like acyl-CoA transferase